MPHEINGLRILEETHDDHDRRLATLTARFWVGKQGPFIERIAKSEYTPEILRAKLEDFACGISRLPGISDVGLLSDAHKR